LKDWAAALSTDRAAASRGGAGSRAASPTLVCPQAITAAIAPTRKTLAPVTVIVVLASVADGDGIMAVIPSIDGVRPLNAIIESASR
jgi:hypothetical protein